MQGLAEISYTQYIIRRYGENVVEELKQKKHDKVYLRRADLLELIEKYED